MNKSRYAENAFDVLLDVQDVDGPQKLKSKMLCKRMVFEGVTADTPFFVGDEISFRYREELGPRHFDVETQSEHISFTDMLSAFEH